tara:strand:- start:139 stop:498 length:360 start_codon:yes stop_codon:yes gene_type:complete
VKNLINNFLGYFFLALGILGTYLPIMPGVVFLIIAAYFFMKSNPYIYNKIITNKYYGRYVKNYINEGIIPFKVKIIILSFIWTFSTISMLYFLSSNLNLQILILVIGVLSSLVIIYSNE